MTMKRLCATVLLLLLSVCAFAVQKSGTIVYINGSKFYIHTVQPAKRFTDCLRRTRWARR